MQRTSEFALEQSRSNKLKQLGLLCYNNIIDGTITFPEMAYSAEEIKKTFMTLTEQRRNAGGAEKLEQRLDYMLSGLGCVCFNMYVDKKLFPDKILALCGSISDINHELKMKDEAPAPRDTEKETGLKVNCPYGMEPIPVNFKLCGCGYRNRSEARYCAKCGAKL